MKHQVESISPSTAQSYLAKNLNNRPLNKKRVNALASAIQRGEWELNGAAIRFSDEGILLDGQHRLAAISKSGETVQSLVVYDLPAETFDTIDVGMASRTAGDVLAMRGEKNYNALAAATRLSILWRNTGNPFNGNPESIPTVKQIESYVDENPSIRDHMTLVGHNGWAKKYMTFRIGVFCAHAFGISNIGQEKDRFFSMLETGEKSQKHCPVFLLRDVLMEDKNARDRMPEKYRCALIFKAYKKLVYVEPTKNLRVRMSGPTKEHFSDVFSLPGVESYDTRQD